MRESLEGEIRPKLSRKRRKVWFGKFQRQVATAPRVSEARFRRYKRVLRRAKEERKLGQRFGLAEMNRELGKLKDSSPGLDKVTKSMLPKTVANQRKLLHFLNKSIFDDEKFDKKLNRTRLVFIDKPESDKPRPLGIGSRVSAVMDRLTAVRFDALIHKDPTYEEAYGFRTDISTEDFYGRMFGVVEAKSLQGLYVSNTQLDVKGAYTSVPHIELILALDDFIQRTENPEKHQYLIHFTAKWLENRSVVFEKTTFFMRCGLVQGSPVSPPLFVIFLSYTTTSKNSIIMKFADDVNCISWAPTQLELKVEVKNEVGKFEKWLAALSMQFEPTKSRFLLFNRTLKTAEKYFGDIGIKVVDGMRTLGVSINSKLNFHAHVQNVKNKLRKRLSALFLFKKIGLSINHGLQFSLCVATLASYGLWWHAYLSKSDWDALESVWSIFLKKSAHEYCPKQANSAKIRELLGVRSFQAFSDYLFHLRTANHHQKPTCKRYTLSPEELKQHRELVVNVTPSMSRKSTQQANVVATANVARIALELKFGTVKAHTITIADKYGWDEASFSATKTDLRKKYGIDRKKAGSQVNLPKFEFLNYLKTLCHSSYYQI